jgi:putative Ca2+/H+ antiporter (TMEM165/GDT1 family)
MTAFLTAFVLVTIAEMADKTQLLTLSLACRYPARRVLVGVGLAIAGLNLLAVVIGAIAGRFIPVTTVKIGAGVLFLGFGLWSLLAKEKPQPEEECEVKSGRYVVLAVTGAFLLAEIGDKTQLATLSLGARFDRSIWESVGVWLGATIGMVLANVLAVVIGNLAGRRIPAKLMKRISGVLFIGFGIWTLVDVLA